MWQCWGREQGPVEGRHMRLWSGNALCTHVLGSSSAAGPTAARQQAVLRAQAPLVSVANMELLYEEREEAKELLANPECNIYLHQCNTPSSPCLCSRVLEHFRPQRIFTICYHSNTSLQTETKSWCFNEEKDLLLQQTHQRDRQEGTKLRPYW